MRRPSRGYGGMLADGKELTCEWIRPDHFGKSTWDRGTVASGTATFISGTTAEDEGFIIFGWMNQQDKPVTNRLKFYKGHRRDTGRQSAVQSEGRLRRY